MIGFISTHQEIGLVIGIWAVFVIGLAIAALWKPPGSTADNRGDSSAGTESSLGFYLAPDSHAWELKAPLARMLAPGPRQKLVLTNIDETGGATLLTAHTSRHIDSAIQRDLENGKLSFMDGTVQRIDYPAQELRVVGRGRIWRFTLDPACQLWFEDKQAVLRCFRPLDHVLIIYAADGPPHAIKAMYAWEKQSA